MDMSSILCHCSGLNFISSEENSKMNISMSDSERAFIDFSV